MERFKALRVIKNEAIYDEQKLKIFLIIVWRHSMETMYIILLKNAVY